MLSYRHLSKGLIIMSRRCYLDVDYLTDEEIKKMGWKALGEIIHSVVGSSTVIYREEMIRVIEKMSKPLMEGDPSVRVIREDDLRTLLISYQWMMEEFTDLMQREPEKFERGREAFSEEEKKRIDGGESYIHLGSFIHSLDHVKETLIPQVEWGTIRIICFIQDEKELEEKES